ncbi:MAG: HD-GYP domain-containing protein [Candidatus Aminicenantales bacterium]
MRETNPPSRKAITVVLEDVKGVRSEFRSIPVPSVRFKGYGFSLDAKSLPGFPGHSRFVAAYTLLLARAVGIDQRGALGNLVRGALLHDIGKIGVPDAILNKTGPLTDLEYAVVRDHPVLGYEMIGRFPFLKESAPIVLFHHERYDGGGYPCGLAGEEIPLGARIFALADTLDAITSDRPYRRRNNFEAAFREIERSKGGQFDPRIVDVFLSVPDSAWEQARSEAMNSLLLPAVH